MNVILSIRPEFCDAILRGEKYYEFRRRIFRLVLDVDYIYVYSTSPIKKIVGAFKVDSVLHDHPKNLWAICKDGAGISEESFFSYFDACAQGYAIKIGEVKEIDPVDPRSIVPDFNPPQSFRYTDSAFQDLLDSYA